MATNISQNRLDRLFLRMALTGFLATFGALGTVSAETRVAVNAPDTLADALAAAGADTVLDLAGGDYGVLLLKDRKGAEGRPIVLRSADPANPARFSGMDLREVSHLVLEGLVFDYVFDPEDKSNFRPFQVSGSQDVTLRRNVFDGDLAVSAVAKDDAYPTAFGMSIRDCKGVVMEANEIHTFYRGLVVSQSTDLSVTGNDVHGIRMDGMNFAEVQRVRIEENNIHDFNRAVDSLDHADMIQFWTNGTKTPSTDIVIATTVSNSGTGWYTQSIFMRNDQVDRKLAGPEMFYRNVTIEENVIINAHLHGITLGETAGVTIRNNTVIRNAASEGKDKNPGLWTPQIRVSPTSTDVRILDNVAPRIVGYKDQADWQVAENVLIQDRFPSQPNFYDAVFVAARMGDPRNLASFAYLPGGPLNETGVGAARLGNGAKDAGAAPNDGLSAAERSDPARVVPLIRVVGDAVYINRFTFEASLDALPAGVSAKDVAFSWDFGDGTTSQEPTVVHSFTEFGPRQVALMLTLPDGETATVRSEVAIPGPDVLSFTSETGVFTAWADGKPTVVPDLPLSGGAAVLGQAVINVPRDAIAPFFGAQEFELRLRFRGVDGFKAAGELLRIHTTLLVNVTERGTLDVRFDTETAEQLRLKTGPIKLFSGEWREVAFSYDEATGLFLVKADGQVVAQGRTSGPIRPLEHWGLSLGNPFNNKKSFDGALESLHLQVNRNRYAIAQ